MKKNILFITAILFANLLQAQRIDYDNLDKEYKDFAIQALASVKPSTKKWVEETALKHPAGKFDTAWAKAQAIGQFSNLGNDLAGTSLMSVLLAYQIMANKEAREDRKITNMSKEAEIKNKAIKLNIDNKKIDQQKQEANEKYNNNMQAANTQLVTGVVSSTTQIENNKLRVKPDSLKQKPGTSGDQQIQKANAAAEKDKDAAAASRDRRKAAQDNIQKMLDKLAELKRNSNF